LFLYAILVIALRMMGRRMSSQLTRSELLALVSLAGGIGPALQDPERGLLPPLVIAVWVVCVQRAFAYFTFRSRRFDERANGKAALLLADGRMELTALRQNAISRDRLFAELRSKGLLQLGAVERVYIETNGAFSIVRKSRARSGLSIVPNWDPQLDAEQERDAKQLACLRCGALSAATPAPKTCPNCRAHAWTPAVRGQ
ncbi:MAG TPA: YetF domain-containing protein, partial [Polyangiales bacterium]